MTPEEIKKMNEDLAALRKSAEDGNAETQKKIASALADRDEKHAKELAIAKAEAKKTEDLQKSFDELQADVKRGNFSGDASKDKLEEDRKNEMKAFHSFLLNGKAGFANSPEVKYLRTDSNSEGGYLCPREYELAIDKSITEFSDILQMADVRTIGKKSIELPKRTGKPTAYWVGEGQTLTGSNATYGNDELRAEKLGAYCDVTFEMMSDSAFDVKSEITADVGEAIADLIGAAYNSGDGVKKPFGFMSKSGVAEFASGNATGIDPDAILGMQGELKKGYNPAFLFNRKTLYQHLATMKGGDGQYLFRLAAAGLPASFAGLSYGIDPNMPDVGAGLYPIMLADWKKFYKIVNGSVIEVIEDNVTQATAGKKRFIFFRRTGGQVRRVEAGVKLKIATSV